MSTPPPLSEPGQIADDCLASVVRDCALSGVRLSQWDQDRIRGTIKMVIYQRPEVQRAKRCTRLTPAEALHALKT